MISTLSSLSTVQLASLVIIGLTIISGIGWLVMTLLGDDDDDDSDPIEDRDDVEIVDEMEESPVPDGGHVVSLEQPPTKKSTLPIKLWRLYKNDKGKKKIGEEGYIRWYLIDDTISEPKYIKPERKGGGVAEYEYEGEPYLFPEDALVPDAKTGMWTAVHKRGDAMPLNLGTPGKPAIPVDELKEFFNKRVTSSPPSWVDNLFGDMETADLMKIVIVGFVGIMLAQSALGGFF